jgi:gluconate 5-dehydrogenase
LGAEIAEGLAEAGASVFLVARRKEWLAPAVEQMKKRGFRCEGSICDVTRPAEVEHALAEALRFFGQVDILVNNAGITWGAETEDMPLDKWRAVIDVNLTGTFLFTQAAGRHMIERGSGSIINVASIAGLIGSTVPGMGIAGYSASKAGVMGLTRELAARWGRHGIRVNAIAPAFFPSRMTEKILAQVQQQYEITVPLRRVGRSGEIKGVAVFLASAASSYITGQTIVVDGGATIV